MKNSENEKKNEKKVEKFDSFFSSKKEKEMKI